jgi:hypothetical protein
MVLAAALAAAAPASAQQILFDNPVKAGDLVFFRDLADEKAYYYAPSKPRLATGANGQPQFSFFRWVENTRSGAKEAEAREGDGGGIIHLLVTFGVPKEMLREAERDLQRQRPGARIAGPIVPKSGQFAIVSSIVDPKDGKSKLATQVIGMGNAPLLDGDKAAVSIQLNKAGAKVLWEQFQTKAPDISFTFDMEIVGFLAPKRALIEANLDEVLKHDAFAVGFASTWLSAEIKGVFDDLRKRNVIKVTQVGEDAAMETLVNTAYTKLTALLFDRTTAEGQTGNLTDLAGKGVLDRATQQLNDGRKYAEDQRVKNEGIRTANAERKAKREAVTAAEARVKELETQLKAADAAFFSSKQIEEQATADATALEQKAAKAAAAGEPGAAEATALRAQAADAKQRATKAAAEAAKAQAQAAELKPQLEAARTAVVTARSEATKAGPDQRERDEVSEPGFAIVGTYQFKRVRATGMFRVDLNKHLSESRRFRFDENIGDLRTLFADKSHFREVNLDDPLYRQREIVAAVDGMNAEDFGQFVNFVSLRLRKKHESGELTQDEIRIDRKNFNQEGNNFKLLYGWKGDKNRTRWMDYEYQAVWSFFGGHEIEQPWRGSSAGAVNLAPPIQRRAIDLQADKKLLVDQGVRSITVKVFYKPVDSAAEQVRQVTLNAAAEAVAGRIEFVASRDALDYDYEISWRLTGNRTLSSGRQTTSSTILHVDEVPKQTSQDAGAPAPGRLP